MFTEQVVLEGLLRQKLLPLYYHDDEKVSLSVLQALYDAGIRLLEYTNRGPQALDNFRALKRLRDAQMPDLILGIGTIKHTAAARQFVDAGADFVVCPSTDAGVGALVREAGLLWVPGCLTATEIATAENAGATLVKIFPGSLVGPGYIKSIRDIFPGMRYVVTGGVEAERANLMEWFAAGVSA
ncbi:MAG TPA: bifunctional 4-hydroxy-2-oxoglutarate aldolase/2-dehydro-3-deoxy-phosphogluconate aldolase, partial [Chitinophagaceae bacterium]|nr:bifunctional 4-hydroxy-2-oxoglutarate aldolase/2-dehydro-3-deoxy-phosphogluconate aldolase [Chitinophagaceae bacterium]